MTPLGSPVRRLLLPCLVLVSLTACGGAASGPPEAVEPAPAEPRQAPVLESRALVGQTPAGDVVRLYYRVHGGSGPLVVMPNAAQAGEAGTLAPLTRGRRLVLYDARGRGHSTGWSEALPVSAELDLADLEALYRHLVQELAPPPGERVSLVGGSYYGALVALYAARHPEHVDKVVMLSPLSVREATWAPYQEEVGETEASRAVQEVMSRGPQGDDLETFCRDYYAAAAPLYFHDPQAASRYDPDFCDQPNEQPPSLMGWLGALFGSMSGWDWSDDARRVEAPVLVVQGAEDRVVPPAGAREWVELLPDARLLEVPDTGHLPLLERPAVVVPAVVEFLSRAPAAPR